MTCNGFPQNVLLSRSAGSLAAAVHLARLNVVSSPSIVTFILSWEVEKKELDDPDDQQNFPRLSESQSVHCHLSACTLTNVTLAGKYVCAVLVLRALIKHSFTMAIA